MRKEREERQEAQKQREIERQMRKPKHSHKEAQVFMSDEARVLVESVISQLQERKRKYLRLPPSSLEL